MNFFFTSAIFIFAPSFSFLRKQAATQLELSGPRVRWLDRRTGTGHNAGIKTVSSGSLPIVKISDCDSAGIWCQSHKPSLLCR
jgi:hypothetical protein